MATFGETLVLARKRKGISLDKIASDLHISKENLEALEKADWQKLPDTAFVKGFVKNYAQYLGLDQNYLLALYRREFDPAKNPSPKSPLAINKSFLKNPIRFAQLGAVLIVAAFIIYLLANYSSFLKSPKLIVTSPPENQTTTVPVTLVTGQTEKGTTIAINGEFAPVDQDGNFSYQYKLEEGQNVIEIIAARDLAPKSKVTRIIRFSN